MLNPLRNWRLSAKVALLGAGSVLITAVTLVTLAVWQSGQYNTLAQREVDGLIDADLDHITQGVYNLVRTENEAVQHQVDYNLNVARHVLANAGSVTLSRETTVWTAINQFTSKPTEIQLPKMLVGGRWLGQNRDTAVRTIVVDEVTELVGETATVFQRMNKGGDMLRVATTVKSTEGKRAIGTYIPALLADGTSNPVIAAILEGKNYHGRAFVVNAWYLTAYEPIKDVAGKVVGMLYVGIKQKNVESRIRQAILQTTVGKTGYVYVLGGKGQDRGRYVISQRSERDGEDIWESRDSDGNFVIKEIINKATHLQPGQMVTERYRWQNPGEPEPRWKIARLAYYGPWDWVIGTSVNEDELLYYRAVLSSGRARMTTIMGLAGLAITLFIGAFGILMAWTIVRPVRQMTIAVGTIVQGHMNQPVDINTQDEIGALAQAFNLMASRLNQTMEGLRKSEEFLNNIVENIPDMVFVKDAKDLRFLRFNRAGEELLGYTRDDLLGKNDYDFFPKDEADFFAAKDRAVLLGKQLVDIPEEPIQTKKMGARILHTKKIAVCDDKGSPQYLLGISEDITDRKHAEEGLRESQQRLADIIEFLPDATFVLDSDKRVIAWNRAIEEMAGVGKNEMIGKGDYAYTVPFYGEPRKHLLDLLDEDDETLATRYQHVTKKGSILYAETYVPCIYEGKGAYVLAVGAPLLDIRGNRVGAIESIRDITDRKNAEDELRKHRDHLEELVAQRTAELAAAKESAERANRAKSEFLANMSHDLRTPLNAIMGYAQILKSQDNLRDKQRDQLNTIEESGEHLLALINDILDLSLIEAQKEEEVRREAFNLPALIHEVLSASGVRAAEKRLSFLYEKDPLLPALVRGDARKLRQILINLLDNAVKYTKEGGVTLKVAGFRHQITAEEQSIEHQVVPPPAGLNLSSFQYPVSSITFQVSDTGIGIPGEQTEAIFEPFVKVGLQATEGIGLGLSISKRLVELMGGRLFVESIPGQGSTFSFTLEFEVVDQGEVIPEEPENLIIGYHGGRKHILIADDNPTNLDMLVSVLEPLGFEIETANNGQETIEEATASKPDLILMDLLMPVVNGHDALCRIRDNDDLIHIKVIGISAAVADKEQIAKFAADCDGFISKPVHIRTLLEKLKEQLGIEWIEEEAGPVSVKEEPAVMPPDDVIEEIFLIVERGDYSALERILSTLTDDRYSAFCRRLRAYARTYDDEGIITYIKGAHHG